MDSKAMRTSAVLIWLATSGMLTLQTERVERLTQRYSFHYDERRRCCVCRFRL
jgi:hypothetical protein